MANGSGQIVVISPTGKRIATISVPARKANGLTFGGDRNDEIFVTTSEPHAIFHARVPTPGFPGHPGTKMKAVRKLAAKSP